MPPRPEHNPAVALVLGCAASGPSRMLASRCDEAARLFESGQARQLLLSGTGAEVDAMRRLIGERGVPPGALLHDRGCRRTLDNVQRARSVFALDEAWIVTSAFHMPRALLLARALGLRARPARAAGPPASRRTLLREGAAWARLLVDLAALRARR